MERLQFDDPYTQAIYDTLKDDPSSLYDDNPDNMLAYNNKMRTIYLILMQENNLYLREAIKQQDKVSDLMDENLKLLKECNELSRKYGKALDEIILCHKTKLDKLADSKFVKFYKNIYKNIRYRLGCINNSEESNNG